MGRNKKRRKGKTNKNKKKIREKKLLSQWFRMLMFLLIFIVLAGLTGMSVYLTAQAMNGILHSDIFAVKKINVVGNARVSIREIKSRLKTLVSPNLSVFDVDIEQLRRNLEECEWIEEVIVKRKLPDRLEIMMKEYEPIAMLKRPDGDYLMDENGDVFKRVTDTERYPYPLVIGTPDENDLRGLKDLIVEYSNIMESRLTQIIFEFDGVLIEDEKGRTLKLNRVDEYQKLRVVKRVEGELGETLKGAKYMDLRFDRRIIVGF